MRNSQFIIAFVTIIFSCYAMMVTHEFGHRLAAAMTNGHVQDVTIPLIGFSHNNIAHSDNPLFTTWAGPIAGVVIPGLLLLLSTLLPHRAHHAIAFFAGFCFIANGAYIGIGSFLDTGDCLDLLYHGAHAWQLRVFGLIMIPLGIYTWYRLGPVQDWFAPDTRHLKDQPIIQH